MYIWSPLNTTRIVSQYWKSGRLRTRPLIPESALIKLRQSSCHQCSHGIRSNSLHSSISSILTLLILNHGHRFQAKSDLPWPRAHGCKCYGYFDDATSAHMRIWTDFKPARRTRTTRVWTMLPYDDDLERRRQGPCDMV